MKKALPWILVILFLVGSYFLDGLMLQFAWNTIMPKVGSFNVINYWLAFAISMFVSMVTVSASQTAKSDRTTQPSDLAAQIGGLLVVKGLCVGIIALLALGF